MENVEELIQHFKKIEFQQLSIDKNSHVDALANIATAVPFNEKFLIPIEFFFETNISMEARPLAVEEEIESWIHEIFKIHPKWRFTI